MNFAPFVTLKIYRAGKLDFVCVFPVWNFQCLEPYYEDTAVWDEGLNEIKGWKKGFIGWYFKAPVNYPGGKRPAVIIQDENIDMERFYTDLTKGLIELEYREGCENEGLYYGKQAGGEPS